MPVISKIPGLYRYPPPASVADAQELADGEVGLIAPELTVVQEDLLAMLDGLVELSNALNVTLPTSLMEDGTIGNNRWLLSSGLHRGKTLKKGGVGAIVGMSQSSIVTRPVVCEGGTTTIISSVELVADSDKRILTVQDGARAIVSNCIFDRGFASTISPVTVETGGKLIINNCIFRGMATTTNRVIAHSGAAANVFASYCFNLTGNTFSDGANVTALGVLA